MASSSVLVLQDAHFGKSALMRCQVEGQPSRRSKKNGDKGMSSLKEQGDLFLDAYSSSTRQLGSYFRIWSRQSLHRFCGRAQTYGNQSDV